jgi:hypothetical protein
VGTVSLSAVSSRSNLTAEHNDHLSWPYICYHKDGRAVN